MAFLGSIAGITDLGCGIGTALGGIAATSERRADVASIAVGIATGGAVAAGVVVVSAGSACGGCLGILSARRRKIRDAVQHHECAQSNCDIFALFSVILQIAKRGDHHDHREHNIHSDAQSHRPLVPQNHT